MAAAKPRPSDFSPIPVNEFLTRTGIDLARIPGCEHVELIVSPRDIARVEDIALMRNEYRNQLLESVGLAENRGQQLYRDRAIHQLLIDPRDLVLGQRYVYRPNYVSIVEELRDLFEGFGVRGGFTQFFACRIVGQDHEGRRVLAHFLPPILERHGARLILMDGVHRNYLARQAGVSIECLVVDNVVAAFPCSTRRWETIAVTDVKPPNIEDRYFDLDRGLFRDVKYIGIDG